MHFGEIKNCDIANGNGVRVTLFVSGCTNRCKNCFQPQTWDFNFGEEFDKSVEERILKMLEPDYIDGFTVLGGEPFEPSNQKALYPFLKRFKEKMPDKSLWIFSGFTLDELMLDGFRARCEYTDKILELTDVLVDGRYEDSLRDISLRFRGSSNQRLIDMNKTREKNEIVIWDGE